jgi:hypothetical protein
MKKLYLLAVLLTAGQLAAAVPVINPSFEEGKKGWDIPAEYSIEPLMGRNSSRGLYINRTSGDKLAQWAQQEIKLEPGKSYRVSCYAKAKITQKGKYKVGASFVLTFYDGKKVVGKIYTNGLIDSSNDEWVRLEREFTAPPEMKRCTLQVGLYYGFLGEAWFDDISVELNDQHFVYTTHPGNRLIFMDKPQVHVAAARTGREISPGTSAVMTVQGSDFTSQASAVLRNGQAVLNFKNLKKGTVPAHLRLLAPDGKTLLAEERFNVNIVESAGNFKGNYVDERGNLIVDGKPFMPFGFYIGQMNKEEIDMISDAGFNTLLSYASMYLRFNYGKPGNPAALAKTLEVMDYCNQKNIKLVFSVSNVSETGMYAINNWYGTVGADNVMRAAIEKFGSHPALLAWYISDEPPATYREYLTRRRNLINSNDPYHPTFMVSMHFNELNNFAGVSDIGGVDPYPIANRSQDMYDVRHAAVQSQKLHKPFWGVVQCFNQAYYTKTTEENHYRYWHEVHRDPSAEEMRSMCFQLAQCGAKGFIFYYWNCIQDSGNRSKDPEYFKKAFARMKEVSAAMRKLEPFVISEHSIETLKPQNVSGKVMATLHKNNDGKRCVVITAEGPGNASAELVLPGRFKSVFGKTVFRNGKYIFKASNISSDMLLEE